jgi:hypothetical protein
VSNFLSAGDAVKAALLIREEDSAAIDALEAQQQAEAERETITQESKI